MVKSQTPNKFQESMNNYLNFQLPPHPNPLPQRERKMKGGDEGECEIF
jgi:hypothetical protein